MKSATGKKQTARDRYVVERRGAMYYVINAKSDMIAAGPYNSREQAQHRADELLSTVWEVRRGSR